MAGFGRANPPGPIDRPVVPPAPYPYQSHDKLAVDSIELPWRYLDGEIHAATPQGLACALAWAASRRQARHVLGVILPQVPG